MPPSYDTAVPPPERHIEFPDNTLLIDLCGGFDRNLAAIEQGFDVVIARRGNSLTLHGEAGATIGAETALRQLYERLETGRPVEQGDVEAAIRMKGAPSPAPTPGQMEMFKGGRMAITGDPSQIDLPRGVGSGLVEAVRVLENVKGIDFVHFTADDVIRHPLVARIIKAYDADGVKR